jgi:PBP1b-binding outer membrane lipoprotein LpoB
MRKTAFLMVGASALLLSGCSNLRDWAGLQKKSPDEFAVTTKAPLVIPPDFNLRPPLPGAPPTNQLDPTANAEQALFNTADPQTVASTMRGNYSMSEKLLLANAGVQNADPGVRSKIAADSRTLQNANRSFTDRVLGTAATPENGMPVNADAEANKRASGGKSGAPAAKKDSGGWFDWL